MGSYSKFYSNAEDRSKTFGCKVSCENLAIGLQRRGFRFDSLPALPHSMRSRVYETVRCLSVAGLLLWVRRTRDIDRLLCLQCFDAVGWATGRVSGL